MENKRMFGVYGGVELPSPLLTEKEGLAIAKCEDKTQLAVEIYEAVSRIRSRYNDWLLTDRSNDSLHQELYQLSEAVTRYYREPWQYNQDVSDAVAAALALYSVHLASKPKGIDIGRIIRNARISSDKVATGDSSDEN